MMYAFVYKSFEECCCDCNIITLMINLMYTIVYKVTEEDNENEKFIEPNELSILICQICYKTNSNV